MEQPALPLSGIRVLEFCQNVMGPTRAGPLSGIRVLEFCQNVMGPTAGMILADLGADVIKVEPAPAGDKTRRLGGFAAGFFGTFNRNKRSLAVDLKQAEGQAVIHRLAATADVVIENYAPGTMDKLGCGWADLSGTNPRLVYCALKGFLSGPYENRLALDEVVQFMGGLAYMTGPPGRPLRAGASVIDIMGGTFAVVAIQAALHERELTGQGQQVKSALFESVAFLMAQHMSGQVSNGEPVPPMPARRSAWAIYEPFRTADDDQIFIGITSDNHWRRFCEEFGYHSLITDPRYATNEDRVRERETLVPMVAAVIAQRSRADMAAIAERIGLPFAPVARTEDLFEDPQLNVGGRMLEVELKPGLFCRLPRLPIELDNHDLALRAQPPGIGRDSRDILSDAGFGNDEILELLKRGIVHQEQSNGGSR